MSSRACSECGRKVRQPARGRTRDTCGRHCAAERTARLKRETRAAKISAAANNALDLAHLRELRHWLLTGKQSLEAPTKEALLTVWADHRCKACRYPKESQR